MRPTVRAECTVGFLTSLHQKHLPASARTKGTNPHHEGSYVCSRCKDTYDCVLTNKERGLAQHARQDSAAGAQWDSCPSSPLIQQPLELRVRSILKPVVEIDDDAE